MTGAGERFRESPGGGTSTPDERAYAEYLDALLRGATDDLDAFLGRHPLVSGALRSRLEALHRMLAGDGDPAATERVPVPAAGDLPLERIGDFRLIKRLGQGGMGVVYLAEQESLRRLVALKVLRPEQAGAFEAGTRFEREVQAIAKLRHPNIVTVFANGEEKGIRYFAMELVPGKGLDERLREAAARGERVPIPTVLRWVAQIARALQCAHEAGIVHRDVKPSNVWIAADGRATLVDFGLARDVRAATLTVTGEFRGTPYYASPEQVAAKRVPIDARTDVYSLGVTLFECVTGRVPFEGETTEQVFAQILLEEPPAPRRLNPSIPRDLETVILEAIEKDPGRRYATAGAFAEDLEALLEVRPIRARPAGAATRVGKWARRNRGWAATGAAGLLALLAVGGIRLEENREASRSRSREVANAIDEARARLAGYRNDRARAKEIESAIEPLEFALKRRFLDWEEEARRMRGEDAARALRRSLEQEFATIEDLLNRGQRLDPDSAAIRDLRADLNLEKWRDAFAAKDDWAIGFFRRRVEENDPTRRHAAELSSRGTLTLATEPAGASAYLFRYVEQSTAKEGGEHRLVPVPVGDAAPDVAPGTWALRVVKGAGEIEENDLLLRVAGYLIEGTVLVAEGKDPVRALDRLVSIDGMPVRDRLQAEYFGSTGWPSRPFEFERQGSRFAVNAESLEALGVLVLPPDRLAERGGVPADVDHMGMARSVTLPAGLVVRTTAAPLLLSPAGLVGRTPLARIPLEPGSYLALLRREGYEDQRFPFVADGAAETGVSTKLNPRGTTPEGFVFVPGGPFVAGGDPEAFFSWERSVRHVPPFWIMEREVTQGEYFEFLNDPSTFAQIAASKDPILLPGATDDPEVRARAPRDAGGRFVPRPVARTSGISPFYAMSDPGAYPVGGISFSDAEAYARWKTVRSGERGGSLEYALPTEEQWEKAARGADGRFFPFGDSFGQKWMKSRYTRRGRAGSNLTLSYPVDESPYGVFDLGGNLAEYCHGRLEPDLQPGEKPFDVTGRQGNRMLRGGACEDADPNSFRAASRVEWDGSTSGRGIRLVARLRSESSR
ncbi:MAG TPA: protein kinase [Planctomycetota bacterium]|jgi:formylglycine-generating enzyme required for sulfatase activity|nr:protein kinase [Planctomycetota bacterium]